MVERLGKLGASVPRNTVTTDARPPEGPRGLCEVKEASFQALCTVGFSEGHRDGDGTALSGGRDGGSPGASTGRRSGAAANRDCGGHDAELKFMEAYTRVMLLSDA